MRLGEVPFLLLSSIDDFDHLRKLHNNFRTRGIRADLDILGSTSARQKALDEGVHVVIYLPPKTDQYFSEAREIVEIANASRADRVTLVASPTRQNLIAQFTNFHRFVVDDGDLTAVFAEVARSAGRVWPAWLDCRFVAEIIEPVGVAWWGRDLIISDWRREVVYQVEAGGRTNVLVAGLNEPHHIWLDRRVLLIANTGADSVLRGVVRPSEGLARLEKLDFSDAGPVSRPHAVVESSDATVVADTSNHRILVAARGRVWTAMYDQQVVYPCGVYVDELANLWVTNSSIGVLNWTNLLLGTAGSWEPGSDFLIDPNGLVRWRDWLIITDEQRKALVVASIEHTPNGTIRLRYAGDLASEWIGSPFGVSINREQQLAVADRELGCVWTIDLIAALKSTAWTTE